MNPVRSWTLRAYVASKPRLVGFLSLVYLILILPVYLRPTFSWEVEAEQSVRMLRGER